MSGIVTVQRKQPCIIGSVPADVVIEILSRVASCSITDLFRCRLSCKDFNRLGRESLVLRRATVDVSQFRYFRHQADREAAYAFLDLCVASENPAALHVQGMDNYFRRNNEIYGMRCLERSAQLGNIQSSYVLGLIMLCCEALGLKETGVNLIGHVRTATGADIVQCRLTLARFLYDSWCNPSLRTRFRPIAMNQLHDQRHGICCRRNRWTKGVYLMPDEDDARSCAECSCAFESKFLCSVL